jgi:hypothetical protein
MKSEKKKKKKPNPKLQGENYYLEERNSWIAIHLEGATLSVYLWSLLISYDSILLDVVDVWKYYSFRYLWEGSRPMDFFASLSLNSMSSIINIRFCLCACVRVHKRRREDEERLIELWPLRRPSEIPPAREITRCRIQLFCFAFFIFFSGVSMNRDSQVSMSGDMGVCKSVSEREYASFQNDRLPALLNLFINQSCAVSSACPPVMTAT